MPKTVTFETPDGEEVEIDPADVVDISTGTEPDSTTIELEDGDEIVVASTKIEVVAELGLNPLDYIDPEDEDDAMKHLDDEDYDPDA
ncbi:hypothetical protein [Novosphingobium sp. Leaf2]|uniref:hypothetical protein n=1 Tax=Novosphingobium sp. Leaf2 TaxID=1735670 RepID=UPI0006F73A46|nr:hypothetical protein [Novosphingobium sp. Leaf2]KQM21026.1 hypothetical protein ASE49_15140 [Novosphingobium sp. Leaf2]